MSAKVSEVTLNTGAKMPAFGLGTWQSAKGAVGAAVEAALRAGYRHVDCAHIYGNEAEIGEALKKCFSEGVCKREDLFITSKLWNTEHGRKDVLPACKLTLGNLGIDYLDLYLIHWPHDLAKGSSPGTLKEEEILGYDAGRMAECWEGMEELVEKELVRAIGISNFTITKTDNLLKTAKIPPAVNQVECHPYFQQPRLKNYLDSKGIVFEAYSPLGNPTRPSIKKEDPVLLEDPVLKEIADKHGVTPAQICIAFQLHRGVVVIPKSVTPSRILENLKATEVDLDDEDMIKLKELDQDCRYLRFFMLRKGETADEFWDVESDKAIVSTEPMAKKTKVEE